MMADHSRRLRKLHGAQRAAAARMVQGTWKRYAARIPKAERGKRRTARHAERRRSAEAQQRMQALGGGGGGGGFVVGGGCAGAATATAPAKDKVEGGDVKGLARRFSGTEASSSSASSTAPSKPPTVLARGLSLVKGRKSSQSQDKSSSDSLLVQGGPAADAPATLASAGTAASASKPSAPMSPRRANDDLDAFGPSPSKLLGPEEVSSAKSASPAPFNPGKQWRPPLQLLLHQHNGRICAIPHVDMHNGASSTRDIAASLSFCAYTPATTPHLPRATLHFRLLVPAALVASRLTSHSPVGRVLRAASVADRSVQVDNTLGMARASSVINSSSSAHPNASGARPGVADPDALRRRRGVAG